MRERERERERERMQQHVNKLGINASSAHNISERVFNKCIVFFHGIKYMYCDVCLLLYFVDF